MPVTRAETLVFTFQVSGANYLKYKEMFHRMGCLDFGNVNDDDKVKTTYTIYVDYIGKVTQNLINIIDLMKHGIIADGNYTELEHGQSLIMELASRIEQFVQLKAQIKASQSFSDDVQLETQEEDFEPYPTLTKEEFFKEAFGNCISEPKKSSWQKLKEWWNG